MVQIVDDPRGVHEGGTLATGHVEGRAPDVLMGDVDQFAEHGDFQLQLDAVECRLERRLVDVEVHKLNDHQRDIHHDTGHVDRDQLHDGLATAPVAIHL